MIDVDKNAIVADAAAKILEDSITGAWKRVCKFFKDEIAKGSIRYNVAYETYLKNTFDKYSKIKTLIYRKIPKDIYSFYECIGVDYNGNIIDTANIENVLNVGHKLIITGTGGMGKSMLFKHLYINTIKTTDFIPVLIELRSFNVVEEGDISLEDAIYNNLVSNGFDLEREYFEYSMNEGGYVIFFDGFDEVNRDKVSKISAEIKTISGQYPDNNYFISSRPSDEFIGWNDFLEMSAMELTKEQALNLIDKIEFDQNVKKKFYNELKDNLFDKYQSFASNPLLLNIMLLTYNDRATFPEKLNDFYEQAFTALFNMHDATKDTYVRDIRTGLGCEDFKSVFAYICFKSYFADQYEFSESLIRKHIQAAKEKFNYLKFTVDDFLEDLTSSVCMLIKDGITFRFTHRSFQEYFAACYTCKLTDTVQKKLLSSWLKESNTALTDSYFSMLFNMQGEKVNEIIFEPILKKIINQYDNLGFTVELLKQIASKVYILLYEEEGKRCHFLSLHFNERQHITALLLVCILNHYDCEEDNLIDLKDSHFDELEELRKDSLSTSIDNIINLLGVDTFLDSILWVKSYLEFASNILKDCGRNTSKKKKTVASILDEL